MAQTDISLAADEPMDDLPRTLRREREARERAAQAAAAPLTGDYRATRGWAGDTPPPAVVTAIHVPFFQLVVFFIKAVFAAIPALFLLGVILWLAGDVLSAYFPWLVKVKVLIHVPPN